MTASQNEEKAVKPHWKDDEGDRGVSKRGTQKEGGEPIRIDIKADFILKLRVKYLEPKGKSPGREILKTCLFDRLGDEYFRRPPISSKQSHKKQKRNEKRRKGTITQRRERRATGDPK